MTNEFVRQTCLLIRHDAAMAEYREDGWKKKALIGAGVAAAVGAAGYAGYKNRGKIGQGKKPSVTEKDVDELSRHPGRKI